MILFNKDVDLKIEVKEDFIEVLFSKANDKYPKEFGGFLIGYYTDNQKMLKITRNIYPDKFSNSSTSFFRSTQGIENKLSEYYENKPREYYIGEWHSHPNGTSMYSNTDLQAMKQIFNCKTVKIKNPILLILSINNKAAKDFSFYLFNDNKLQKYER